MLESDGHRPHSTTTAYDASFFDSQVDGSLQSAGVVVPIVMDLVAPKSVVDVGCGRGPWLRQFQDNGVTVLRGIDGDYVNRAELLFPPDRFRAVDLSSNFDIGEKFDLAVCLEVAEHLPESCARGLVDNLTRCAPVVLFSAAVPDQGGTHHLNEQWPTYWKALFAQRKFTQLDLIRPKIWRDGRIDWWYRQNSFLYASQEAIARIEAFRIEAERKLPERDLVLVHNDILHRYDSFMAVVRLLPKAAARAVKRSLFDRGTGTSTHSAR